MSTDPGSGAAAGFEEVHEIVPRRLYEAWADGVCYRIAVTRPIVTGSSVAWNSSIDMLDSPNPFAETQEQRRIWIRPFGIPSRLLGDTPDMALRDAMRWLGEWAGFDEMGRARRDAKAAEEMDPKLRAVVDAIDQVLSEQVGASWRDRDRARWTAANRDFFVSRLSSDEINLFTYVSGTSKIVGTPEPFELSLKGAKAVARRIRESVPARHREEST